MQDRDLADLAYAKSLLENPGLAAKITSLLGTPIEKGFALLPRNWSQVVSIATRKALTVAIEAAVLTLDKRSGRPSSDFLHKMLVAASGAGGGFFGLPALSVELPISTTIMMRSIADIARSEGETISDPHTKMACIEVFALGGPGASDDAAETGYFAVRAALSKAVSDAAEYIARRGIVEEGAPTIVRLIAQIASRFGVQVSEKAAAQAIPVIGAAGGSILNTLFMDHFQGMARGHFIVRRLESRYGREEVRRVYRTL